MRSLRQRLFIFVVVLLLVIGGGTAWYWLIEGWNALDALYMTVITLTTVGFQEVEPLGARGRLFTTFLILLGVGTVAYGLSTIGEYLLTSGVIERLQKRGVMREIKKMDQHAIICGAGRVGMTAAATMEEMGTTFVIIDEDPEDLEEARDRGWVVLDGDATRDEVLQDAGIERAAGLLVCTGSDATNLFIVLSARSLNPNLLIVSRSVDAASDAKIRRAGADKVISPYQIGGRHMANLALRPHVTEFLDVVTLDSGLELWLEEVIVREDSQLAGKTVVEADLRRQTGVTLIALIRGSDHTTLTPDENTRFEIGDELIVLGTRSQLAKLEELIGGPVGHPHGSWR